MKRPRDTRSSKRETYPKSLGTQTRCKRRLVRLSQREKQTEICNKNCKKVVLIPKKCFPPTNHVTSRRILKPSPRPLRQDPEELNTYFVSTVERNLGESSTVPLDELMVTISNLPDASPSDGPQFQLKPVSHRNVLKCYKSLRSDPGAPLTNFNDKGGGGGGSDRGSYITPKKITPSEFVYPKKSLLFLACPKKSLRFFRDPKKSQHLL